MKVKAAHFATKSQIAVFCELRLAASTAVDKNPKHVCGKINGWIASCSPPIEFTRWSSPLPYAMFASTLFEFDPIKSIKMSWFVTKALAECVKCYVTDNCFEFRQLRGTCLGTGLTESTKYSAWDLGLPEITVYTELVIKRTTRFI